MWNNIYLLILDERDSVLKHCTRSYINRYNIKECNIIRIRNIIEQGGIYGNELSCVTINDRMIVIGHAEPLFIRCQGRGNLSPFQFVELLYELGLKEVGIISFKCCRLGKKTYLSEIKNELYDEILVGYMSAYRKSAVTIFGHEGVGFVDSMVRLFSFGFLKLPNRLRVNVVKGNCDIPLNSKINRLELLSNINTSQRNRLHNK